MYITQRISNRRRENMNRFLIMPGSVVSLIPGPAAARDAEIHPENEPELKLSFRNIYKGDGMIKEM